MTILRTGSNEKYANNWSDVFGSKKTKTKTSKVGKKSAKKKSAKKSVKKKKARRS
ncbi:MAG: hypothetical protein MK108_14180 [Mariniblastus sp.]|nr:hypothetical protein [Mariniblastus sp.]